jgi:hypothetical protein
MSRGYGTMGKAGSVKLTGWRVQHETTAFGYYTKLF